MDLSLAPLHGLTNRTFRAVWFRHFGGFDRVVAPFIVATPSAPLKRNFYKDLSGDPPQVPRLIPQVLGNDAISFLEASRALAERGYEEINWNLGCPYPMVANKFRGSGLLPHPERVDRFLDMVCRASPIPLSVKLRLGRWLSTEIDTLLPILERYPLKELILHPRTGVQLYGGSVDLEAWDAVAKRCRLPLVYNGDVTSVSSFMLIVSLDYSPSAVMIGRGALIDPFLPADIRAAGINGGCPGGAPSILPDTARGRGNPLSAGPAERLEKIRLFMEDMEAAWREILFGPAHVLDKMKELWSWTGQSLLGVDRERALLKRVRTLPDYYQVLDALWQRALWTGFPPA